MRGTIEKGETECLVWIERGEIGTINVAMVNTIL